MKVMITHTDLDGAIPVLLARLYNDILNVNVIMRRDYGFEQSDEDMEIIKKADEILMVDICVPEETYNELNNMGKKIEMYDHHLASQWADGKIDGKWTDEICGTKIFWEYCIKPKVKRYPPLLEYIINLTDIYDCWREDNPLWQEAKYLNYVLYGIDFYKWNAKDPLFQIESFISLLEYKIKQPEWIWTDLEMHSIQRSLENEKEAYEKAISNLKVRTDSKGRKFGLIVIGSKISLVCSKILAERKDLDYIVGINSFKGVNGRLSFRSKSDNFDVTELACCNGHSKSGGGQFNDISNCMRLWNEEYSFRYKDSEFYNENDESTFLVKPGEM